MVGSDPEFERLFDAEFASVMRTVFLICHDYYRAQDLAQDAFVELLRKWDRVSRYDRPGAWVRRVAIRLAVRSVQRERMRRHAEQTAGPPLSHEPADLDVMDAVKTLPAQQRAAVVLYYFEDATVADIAEVLGCSPSTARVHLHRARERVRHLLAEEVSPHGE